MMKLMTKDDSNHARKFLRITTIPLILVISGLCWFVVNPDFKTFIITISAFFLWVGTLMTEWIVHRIRFGFKQGKKLVEKGLDEYHSELRGFKLDRNKFLREPLALSLLSDLETLEKNPSLRPYVYRAMKPLQGLIEQFLNFRDLLQNRLSPQELTYQRYIGTAQEVYDLALGNFHEAILHLRSFEAVNSHHTGAQGDLDKYQVVESLLEQNQRAIDQLTTANLAVLEMKGNSLHNPGRLENAMLSLENLSKRAKKY